MAGTISFANPDEDDLDVHMPPSSLESFCEYLTACIASNPLLKADGKFVEAVAWPLRSRNAYLGLNAIQTSTLKEVERVFQELTDEDHPYWETWRKSYTGSAIKCWQDKGKDVDEWIEHLKNENRIRAARLADMAQKRIAFLESK